MSNLSPRLRAFSSLRHRRQTVTQRASRYARLHINRRHMKRLLRNTILKNLMAFPRTRITIS